MNLNHKIFRHVFPAVILAAFAAFTIYLNISTKRIHLIERRGQTFEKGVVEKVLEDNIQEDGTRVGQQTVLVRLLTGTHAGETLETTSSAGFLFGAACKVGMKVVVMQSVAGSTVITTVYAQNREGVIYVFGALYIALLVLIGGWKGAKGAAGLLFTLFALIFVYIPLVYRGFPPFLAAVFLCLVTTIVTMWFIGGAGRKTFVASAGTVAGVVMAYVSAKIFGWAAGLSGWNVSNIENLLTLFYTNEIQVGELLFSALVISSLGAVMDVAMSVASAMEEITRQNPKITRKELFKSGLRVGRDMMGTDSNTLILAFAGGNMSELVLDFAYELPYRQIINSNNIALAVMQGICGSFGVVLAVPVTVALASVVMKRK